MYRTVCSNTKDQATLTANVFGIVFYDFTVFNNMPDILLWRSSDRALTSVVLHGEEIISFLLHFVL
jgi:hypothetical protein